VNVSCIVSEILDVEMTTVTEMTLKMTFNVIKSGMHQSKVND